MSWICVYLYPDDEIYEKFIQYQPEPVARFLSSVPASRGIVHADLPRDHVFHDCEDIREVVEGSKRHILLLAVRHKICRPELLASGPLTTIANAKARRATHHVPSLRT